jgi:hypothetical protein
MLGNQQLSNVRTIGNTKIHCGKKGEGFFIVVMTR